MAARTQDRDQATTWTTREAQYDAVCTWGIPDHALLQRLAAIEMPVFAANGDSDPMILPHYSYLLAGLIPHARVTIYPDAAVGMSGARLVLSLALELRRRGGGTGAAAVCGGGGQGDALIVWVPGR